MGLFNPHGIFAQNTRLSDAFPYSANQISTLLTLDQSWKETDGTFLSIPFVAEDKDELLITYSFQLNCTPTDSLFLFFEGVGWNLGVELNNRYLGNYLYPFSGFSIPISPEWIAEDENIIRLSFTKDVGLSFHPSPFVALLKPPLLMERWQKERMTRPYIKTVVNADTVALLAPYYRKHAYKFELGEAYRVLKHLIDNKIKHVYFLFAPSQELKTLCAQLGLTQVEEIGLDSYVCFANTYPYDAWQMDVEPLFWLDEKGNRTRHYATYFKLNQRKANNIPFHGAMVWMILSPLFGLLLIKLLNPSFFYALPGIFASPKLFIDNFSDASYSSLALIFVLQIVKIISLSASASMMIYYLQQVHDWQVLNIFHSTNLFQNIFDTSDPLFTIFTKVSVLLFGWMVFRYILNSFLGNIYKIKGMALGALNLDIIGSYPLVILLSIPVALLIFAQTQWNTFFLISLILIGGIYTLRKLYVLYIGLDKLFSFSLGVKILYICALNIIPYMILF